MPHQYYFFTTPAGVPVEPGTQVTMAHDGGWGGTAVPSTDPAGRAGVVFDVPDTVLDKQGAQVNVTLEGKVPQEFRGVLVYEGTRAYLKVDDVRLVDLPAPPEPPEPPPVTGSTPLEIINAVYATGQFNLATKAGCGTFTEECARQLATAFGPQWGHVAKSPGQNQYNNHAVDALYALYGSDAGVWDIIQNSVSTSAKPAFNDAGEGNPEEWRPAEPLPVQPVSAATRDVDVNLTVSPADFIRLLAWLRVI